MIAKRKARRMTKTRRLVKSAFHEVKHNEPKVVAHTRERFGEAKARAQRIAIALSKARKAGAKLPKYKKAS